MTIEREIEIKLEVQDFLKVEETIKKLGFSSLLSRSFEKNLVFDTPTGGLTQSHSLLRLRQQGDTSYLTVKKPLLPAEEISGYKARNEIEIVINDFQKGENLLLALEYRVFFVYEKYRTTYGRGNLKVMLDETPIGNFVEVEGSPEEIDELTRKLGFGKDDYITDSYYGLFLHRGISKYMCFE